MSSLQIPLVFDVLVPAPPKQTQIKVQGNDSDNDFQTCPQMPKTQKGKDKVDYHQPPVKKKLRSVGPVPPQKQTNLALKPPGKRTSQHRSSVSPIKKISHTLRKSPTR